jgi:hypothetical protein
VTDQFHEAPTLRPCRRDLVNHMPDRLGFSGPPGTVLSVVAPGTFAAPGIALKSGRDFNDRDTYDAPFTAVINEALVRKSFRGENPIGRTIFCPFDSAKAMTIIGVVGDVRQDGPAREPTPECYMPYQQHRYNGATLSIVARSVGDPTALEETLRRLARDRSPEVPMKFTTMEAALWENVAAPEDYGPVNRLVAGQQRQHAGSRRPYPGNRVGGFALRRQETARGAAEYFQQVREEVHDGLRPAETDGDINQHRYDTHEGTVQHAPLRRLPRDPYSEYQGCDERRRRCAV